MNDFSSAAVKAAAKIWKRYYSHRHSARLVNFYAFCERLNVRWYAVYDYMLANAMLNHRYTPQAVKNQTNSWDDILFHMDSVQTTYEKFADFQKFIVYRCVVIKTGALWQRVWVDWNERVRYVELCTRKPKARAVPFTYNKQRTRGKDVDVWLRRDITLKQYEESFRTAEERQESTKGTSPVS
jgi:hypothetical protein